MILRLSLDLPEDATYVRTTRLLSRTLLEDMKVTKTDIDEVETIVAELYTNVVRHAKSKETHFLVTLEYYKPQVVITVTDAGEGFAPKDVAPVGTVRADFEGGERMGGWGLALIEGLTDKLDFTRRTRAGRPYVRRRTCTTRPRGMLRRLRSGTRTAAAR